MARADSLGSTGIFCLPILKIIVINKILTILTWLIWKDSDARKDWRQEEKGMTEDDMVGGHHWLNGQEFE